jgi:hypothetical protein
MTYPSGGTGAITLTIDATRDGIWSLGEWSVTFPDARYSDRGTVQFPVSGQKPDPLSFFLLTSRSCQGPFGPIEVMHIVVVSVVADHMSGRYTESACTFPDAEGTLDLRRR